MEIKLFSAVWAGKPLPTEVLDVPTQKQNQIMAFAWEMKKNGNAESTIETIIQRLTRLTKLCNINEPEQVKTILATLKWENSTKTTICKIYTRYLKYIGKKWEEPKYKIIEKLPFIPTETEIDQLIASGSKKTATLLQLLKETGARIGEAQNLKWTDLDTVRKTIHITPEKGSNPRILPTSTKLIAMLNLIPKTHELIFPTLKKSIRTNYDALRNRTALKLSNPRINQIKLHTFRHWKATMEYHKTKDIIKVKNILGHKEIKSTMKYINIEASIFLTESDEYTCKTASTTKEAINLIETGFEYITEMEGLKIFKKRK
jgi:integrase